MSTVLHYVWWSFLGVWATFGVVELLVFLGAAFITRMDFDFDDERDQ